MERPSKTEHRGTAAWRVYRLGFLCLGVLCILQASLNITLRLLSTSSWCLACSAKHVDNVTSGEDRLKTSLRRLTTEKEQLQTSYNQLQDQFHRLRAQTQSCGDGLQRRTQSEKEKEQLQTSYNQLRNQMQSCSDRLQRTTERVQKTCPDGWRRRDTSMYYIGTGGKDWNQSRQDCRERGSDLVIINSLEEQRFIQELELEVWIGLTEISSTWTWVDGSSLSSGYWITGEPNEYRSGEDCAESKPNPGSLNSWNDERCTTYLNWVCEREAC